LLDDAEAPAQEAQPASGRSGSDYLAGLAGRSIYLDGRHIADPLEESTLRGIAEHIAGLVDAGRPGGLLCGADGTPAAYSLAHSLSDLRARGRAFSNSAKRSGGLLGRSPDFLATVLTSWRGASAYFGESEEALVAYWESARSDNLVLTHAISDPPAGRYGVDQPNGLFRAVREVGKTQDGIVVRGAKMLATLSPFADDLVVYPYRALTEAESDQAMLFSIPLKSPGLTLYARPSLAPVSGSDYQLASRFDELDAIVVFDDVLVPWERLFLRGDVGRANGLRNGTGMTSYAWHQSAARAYVKAEFVRELAEACTIASNRVEQEATRQHLGELAGISETLRSLVIAAEAEGREDEHGHFVADPVPLAAAGMLNATLYPRAVELLQLCVSSGLVVHPLTVDETIGSPAHPFYASYFSGASGAFDHGRLLRAAAEVALDRFGARQVLYERVFLGPPDAFKAKYYEIHGVGDRSLSMVDDLIR